MTTRRTLGAAAASCVLLALAGCGAGDGDDGSSADGGDTGNGGYGAPPATDDEGPDGSATGVVLRTADTELGTIVVDGDGMTLYQFDSDEQGAGVSTCEGQCARTWPAVPGGEMPDLDGITGEPGTITGVDGQPHLTLGGWPLYYYVGDQAAGDLTGQGVGDVWWVLTPDGEPVRGMPPG